MERADTMMLWDVEIDPGVEVGPLRGWGTVIAQAERAFGRDAVLVEADEAGIAAVRVQPGVWSVQPAEDGRYLDIEEGAAYRVSHGGTHVERVE
jgi:hypothetical protein